MCVCVCVQVQGKRNHTTPCSSDKLFFAENKGCHKGKTLVVDMVSLVLKGFYNRPPAWKSFFEAKMFPNDLIRWW